MDGPPAPKKLRLTTNLPSDPSIPLTNGSSPFQVAPQDIIDHIFRHLADRLIDTKEKMQLEIVCSLFRRRITLRDCWIWNNKLSLACCDNEDGIMVQINGTKFLGSVASVALAIFLQRSIIWQFEFCESFPYPVPLALGLQTQIIVLVHHESFLLQKVESSLNDSVGVGDAILLSGLAASNLSQMHSINISPDSCTEDFKTCFWSFVFRCQNLTTFFVEVAHGSGILDKVDELAEHCPNIKTIQIRDYSDGDMQGLAVLFANLQKLNYVSLMIGRHDIPLLKSLDNPSRSRIETLLLELGREAFFNDEEEVDNEETEEFLQTVPDLFPNLKKFIPNQLGAGFISWDTSVVANLIKNAVRKYAVAGRGPYEFTLELGVNDEEALIRLVQAMNVTVETNDHHRCKLVCRKDDLVIKLHLT